MTLRHSRRTGDWKTKPRSVSALLTGRPPMQSVPEVGKSRPAMMRSSVLLPHPLGPTMERNSPGWMSMEVGTSASRPA